MSWFNHDKYQQELAEFNAEWAEARQAINEEIDEFFEQADYHLSIKLGKPHTDRAGSTGSGAHQTQGSLLAGYEEL